MKRIKICIRVGDKEQSKKKKLGSRVGVGEHKKRSEVGNLRRKNWLA